jgi:hypothetical protein
MAFTWNNMPTEGSLMKINVLNELKTNINAEYCSPADEENTERYLQILYHTQFIGVEHN